MILVTGATGKTGQAVVEAAAGHGLSIRAAIHRETHAAQMESLGAQETTLVDLLDGESLANACAGVDAIYHICPNVHPQEVEIGALLLEAARRADVRHIFYHSVLHPQIEAMPHHWRKLRVEELLIQSGVACTILQPTAYMQNLPANLQIPTNPSPDEGGVRFVIPYSLDARISLVDLADVAEVAARLLAEEQESGGLYPLVGTPPLSQREVAAAIGAALGREVTPVQITTTEWRARASSLDDDRADALIRMFDYYDRHGLIGSTRTLRSLLGREPRALEEYLDRALRY